MAQIDVKFMQRDARKTKIGINLDSKAAKQRKKENTAKGKKQK